MRIAPTNADRVAVRVTELEKALSYAQACARDLPATGPGASVAAHVHTAQSALCALKVDLAYLSALAMASVHPAPVVAP